MWVPASVIHLWTLSVLCAAWLKEAERRATASDTRGLRTAAHCALITPMLLIILIGCDNAPRSESSQVVGGHPQRGLELIQDYGCGTCHTIPGIGGADGNVGPPLAGLGERLYIAGVLRNTPDNLIYRIRYPQRVLPRGAMPNMGVGAQDARDIAAYLYTLH
jgi:mono/diheme cytochrome c family protein